MQMAPAKIYCVSYPLELIKIYNWFRSVADSHAKYFIMMLVAEKLAIN
jgi:hypothetical protein